MDSSAGHGYGMATGTYGKQTISQSLVKRINFRVKVCQQSTQLFVGTAELFKGKIGKLLQITDFFAHNLSMCK